MGMSARKSHLSSNPDIRLSISFSGPMFFDFSTSSAAGRVDIYVPYCPYHQAGFFFLRNSYSESDLYACAVQQSHRQPMPRVYSVSGKGIPLRTSPPSPITSSYPAGNPPATTTPGNNKRLDPNHIYILSIDGLSTRGTRARLPKTTVKRLLQFSVPMPACLSTLYTATLQVIPGSGKPSSNFFEHCTALRFYYEWDATSDVLLDVPFGAPRSITPPIFTGLPPISEISIRYEGIELEDDNDPHSDARSCFASLTALAGTDWWPNFGDGRTSPTGPVLPSPVPPPIHRDPCLQFGVDLPKIKTGADCHAPIITMGLTL
jgi:hypothetical protein